MLTDAHCHPFDLVNVFPKMENERKRLSVAAAASACDLEEFAHNEILSLQAASEKAAPLYPCFAVHPQMLADSRFSPHCIELLETLEKLAAEKRLAAIGECGFDLYNTVFKETEKEQEKIFSAHLEIALRYDLPVVIHVRRAMHKIFAHSKELAKCKNVVFHSWPGTLEEGNSLLRLKVNAYFSFGNTILNGHKHAVRSCEGFEAQRILTETDAPYQPVRGTSFSRWEDLQRILETSANLRGQDVKELENQIEINFNNIFCIT